MTGPDKRFGDDPSTDARPVPDAQASGTGVPAPRRAGTGDGTVPADRSGAAGPAADGGTDGSSSTEIAARDEVAATVAALTTEEIDDAQRSRLLARLAAEVRRRGVGDLFKPRAAMRWIADTLGDVAPRIPIRDLTTLRAHHDGLDGDALADRLIRNASLLTASIGAASGGVAAVEWVVTPTLLTTPVLLAVETVVVVAVEVKLIGELHAVYRQPLPGTLAQRGSALLQAWAQRRGVNPLMPSAAMNTVLGTAARKELRDRLLRRFSRNITSLGPMLTGAAVAGYLNRRATLALAEQVRRDLSRRAGPD
ncbi:MAG TPA: hypothetical protein VF054_17510 [Micromonosporaceae bacterium]